MQLTVHCLLAGGDAIAPYTIMFERSRMDGLARSSPVKRRGLLAWLLPLLGGSLLGRKVEIRCDRPTVRA
jgi:hypothetical protein